ncbi:universal stress protein [Aquimarina rhabdastrellae]
MSLLPQHKFKTILIGIAFSPNLKNNIYEAMRMVDFFDAQLILVHVGVKTKEKIDKIDTLLSRFPNHKEQVTTIWQEGDPVNVIINAAKDNHVDLIMLGALQREQFFKFYVGSIARKITRKASCSVLLLIKPSENSVPCKHIVVNGLKDKKTEETIATSFGVAQNLGTQKITVVEEISQQEVHFTVQDDESLRKNFLRKEQLSRKEDLRVQDILKQIPETLKNNITIKTQSIFGKRGYSIGHYARVVGADLLIMNAPKRTSLWDRIFPHDLEYILSELPTDVLIVR